MKFCNNEKILNPVAIYSFFHMPIILKHQINLNLLLQIKDYSHRDDRKVLQREDPQQTNHVHNLRQ